MWTEKIALSKLINFAAFFVVLVFRAVGKIHSFCFFLPSAYTNFYENFLCFRRVIHENGHRNNGRVGLVSGSVRNDPDPPFRLRHGIIKGESLIFHQTSATTTRNSTFEVVVCAWITLNEANFHHTINLQYLTICVTFFSHCLNRVFVVRRARDSLKHTVDISPMTLLKNPLLRLWLNWSNEIIISVWWKTARVSKCWEVVFWCFGCWGVVKGKVWM